MARVDAAERVLVISKVGSTAARGQLHRMVRRNVMITVFGASGSEGSLTERQLEHHILAQLKPEAALLLAPSMLPDPSHRYCRPAAE